MSLFGAPDNTLIRGTRGSYANPHSTVAIQDIPTNLKQLFRLTRYYFTTDALIRAIIDKMSEYPITNIIITPKAPDMSQRMKDKWNTIINTSLNLRRVMKHITVDESVYGHSFHYVYYPFVRYAICDTCKGSGVPLKSFKKYVVKANARDPDNFTFTVNAKCEACNANRNHKIEDRPSHASSGFTMVRLNPLRMELEYDESSDTRQWYWRPSQTMRAQFLDNVRTIIENAEMRVLGAAMIDGKIKLDSARLWVTQSDAVPGVWAGWGFPPIFPALEDVYYYKILRRANEAIAQEHVTPTRFLSPGVAGDASAQRTMNLADWQNKLRVELQKGKRDPNHIVISPIPINVEQMGGNARAMMVASEMEAAARIIAAAIGCPIEMIWGGLNWSGASVSLRVLENHFLNTRESHQRLLDFIAPRIRSHYKMDAVTLTLSDFKMADDVQKESNFINMMTQGFMSRKSVLKQMNLDHEQEFTQLAEEHKALNKITMQDNLDAAHMNSVIKVLDQKGDLLAQYEVQLEQQRMQAGMERQRLSDLAAHVEMLHQKGLTSPIEFDQSAAIIRSLQPQMQQVILTNWSQTMPLVTQLLMYKMGMDQQLMASQPGQGAQSNGAADGAGMAPGAQGPYNDGGQGVEQEQADGGGQEPAPEQRPPRRQNGA